MTAPAWEIRVGDVLDRLREMPSESVHCVVTSPPYWGLRSYIADGDDLKPLEMGLEATPAEYLARMVVVFREVRRVMRSDATLWLNMGDGYAGSAGIGRNDADRLGAGLAGGHGGGTTAPNMGSHARQTLDTGLKPKDLVGMPWRLALALQADGWWLRSEIIWAKPNPMPESVQDRPTKAHEQIYLFVKTARYFYDADAIREPAQDWGLRLNRTGPAYTAGTMPNGQPHSGLANANNAATGRNARSVWTIATQPFPEAHFATFPEELPRRCILAGSPEGGTVLDPFAGSGTTLLVAVRHGRSAIGIELNPEYAAMARRRILADHGAVEPTNGHTPAEARGVQGRLAF